MLYGETALYLARYLNVPPTALPGEGADARFDRTHAEDLDRHVTFGPGDAA